VKPPCQHHLLKPPPLKHFENSSLLLKEKSLMSDFVQLHLLTVYGPSNLNRDDTGRPKSAVFGGTTRLRVSSQSLKRAWRESEIFARRLDQHMGQRTQRLGKEVLDYLVARGMAEDKALDIAKKIAVVFGKVKKETDDNPAFIEQLAFISPEEKAAALALADQALAGEAIEPKAEALLQKADTAADIAMFGRMLADNPAFNREAAVQVAHALTTHKAAAEDDYYTALDDLKAPAEDAGAAFLGIQEFGAGVFYLYICIDRGLLERNLGGNRTIRDAALMALVEAAAKVAPGGKQNSFASRANASFILAEKGTASPRSLVAAFLKPVTGDDHLALSIERLHSLKDKLDKAYGPGADAREIIDTNKGEGSLEKLLHFVVS
jgi:CRISPR system Cascade subunit CasC